MTNLWSPWYADVVEPRPYLIDDSDATYRLGAEWLDGLFIFDWGCGLGWMRRFVPPGKYTGIDGTPTPFADVVADLATYDSLSEAIFMRHVLEHNIEWRVILRNAVASFTKRMFLVLYTPLVEETHVYLTEPELGVPEIHFRFEDITEELQGLPHTAEPVGSETVIRIEK
jgi:hypothetical protein